MTSCTALCATVEYSQLLSHTHRTYSDHHICVIIHLQCVLLPGSGFSGCHSPTQGVLKVRGRHCKHAGTTGASPAGASVLQQGTSGSSGGRPSKLTIILLATIVPCAVVVSPVHASCQLLKPHMSCLAMTASPERLGVMFSRPGVEQNKP